MPDDSSTSPGSPARTARESVITSAIETVTVYPSQARIVRRGTAVLTATGEQTVVLDGLPEGIDTDSVRAAAAGPAGLMVTGVEVRFGSERLDGRVTELRDDVDRLSQEWRELDDTDAVLGEELDQVVRMRTANAKRVAGAGALEEAEAVAATLSERSLTIRGRRRELAVAKRELTRRLDAARAALEAAEGGGVERSTREVVVGLDVATAGEVDVTVSYLVWDASWYPVYDLRLVEDRLGLTYLASVQQGSGEDWPAVPIGLSTARPGATGVLPDPDPWYVDLPRPVAPHPVARSMQLSAPAGMPAADDAVMGWTAQAKVAAESDQAVLEESGTARVFRSARPVAVPSDHAAHRVPITVLDLPARTDHVCAPRLSTEVHARATVTNASPVTLLPGSAAVFRGEEFVGRTQLELIAPDEEIELHLGIEERIDVERELVRRDARRAGLIGSSGRTVLAYQTTVTSYLPDPVRLVLIDQVPVAHHPELSVKVLEVRLAPARTDDLGRYEWDLDLTPRLPTVIRYEFAVEGPRDKRVTGLG